MFHFRQTHPPGAELPAKAALCQCLQQHHPGHPARGLHQHVQARQADPDQEQDHQAGPPESVRYSVFNKMRQRIKCQ